MNTKQTVAAQALRIARLAMERIEKLESVKPIKGEPHGATLEVDHQTKRQMAAEAQALGLRSADELAQIVCRAFVDLCEQENCITFPLMLQQVPTV